MQYMRYQEAEMLLKIYQDLKVMSENIRRQIKCICEESDNKDDDIAALALRHASFDDVPGYSAGLKSDKTCKTAIDYQKLLDNESAEALQELMTELILLENIIEKVDAGLTILSEIQKKILKLYYWEGFTWSEIADKLLMTASTCKQWRKQAIDRFCPLSRITVGEYEAALRLFS